MASASVVAASSILAAVGIGSTAIPPVNAYFQRLKSHPGQYFFPKTTSSTRIFLSSQEKKNSRTYTAALAGDQREIMWDQQSQTYMNGVVPSHHDSSNDIDTLLAMNGDGKLKIFGYGSLCWHPGSDGGVLRLANREEDEVSNNATEANTTAPLSPTTAKGRKGRVTTSPGLAIGYQRCWSQRSADHRGTPQFNGIVCTLLSDAEVARLEEEHQQMLLRHQHRSPQPLSLHPSGKTTVSMTEGLIYTIDGNLAQDCLTELDFREKGVSQTFFSIRA